MRHARDRSACIALLVVISLALGWMVLALSDRAQRRSGTNGVLPSAVLATAGEGAAFCQQDELLPADTAALRIVLNAEPPPAARVSITLRRDGRVLDRTVAAGWRGNFVDAPIRRTSRDLEGVDVCFRVERGMVGLIGGARPANTGALVSDGRELDRSIPIEYLRPGKESWWSYASTVVGRMGMGRGDWGGTWIVGLIVLLTLGSLALAGRVVARTLLSDPVDTLPAGEDRATAPWQRVRATARRVPSTAWAILAIGALNATAWSLITPMFQGPDEITHVAYAQRLGETGRPPIDRERTVFAPELLAAATGVRIGLLGRGTQHAAVWSPSQQRQLEHDLHADLSRRGNDDVGGADPEPPLYYGLEAVAYRAASGATLLDRVALMRLLSAAMGGLTAMFVFLFARECLPGRPWAWTVGGLAVAFMPMFGFVSGVVNPDALLFAVCAALFWGLARAFRRGLTTRLAVWIGVALAVGALGKINFYGLVPGALVAVALAAWASERAWSGRVIKLTSIVVAVGFVPYAVMLALDALVWERAFILARTPAALEREAGGPVDQLSALWQVYLPRLPWQDPAFEISPVYDPWFKSFIGKFGPLVAAFSERAYHVAIVLLAIASALAIRAMALGRAELKRRWPELLGYLLMAGGLLLLIGMVAVRGWAPGIAAATQGRYLLPLLAPFAVFAALAARGAGDRWGRAVGAAIVVIAIAWGLFGQLVTIAYYYG